MGIRPQFQVRLIAALRREAQDGIREMLPDGCTLLYAHRERPGLAFKQLRLGQCLLPPMLDKRQHRLGEGCLTSRYLLQRLGDGRSAISRPRVRYLIKPC
jgi:hypothetical protein